MKILLVEDDLKLGVAVKRNLNREKYVVDWVRDGSKAWNYLEKQQENYMLAIFDWEIPGLSGLELCKQLRIQNNSLPVLMVMEKDSLSDKVTALDAGADDCMVKPFDMAELLARLRALQRRSRQIQPPLLQVGDITLEYGTQTVYRLASNGGKQVTLLTNKKFQLLEYFMKHPNQTLTSDQILHQFWKARSESISNVVAAQIRLLRRQLARIGSDHLIETVYFNGYRFNATDQPK